MTQKDKVFIGIDVSKATLDISMGGNHFKINNDQKAISSFIEDQIASKKIVPTLVCLEATGGYENLTLSLFQSAHIAIHRAHPNKVHAFAKASGHFAKTDKLDAKLLEKYAGFVSNEQPGDRPLSACALKLTELRRLEHHLMDHLHAIQCRLEHASETTIKYLEQQIDFISNQIKLVREDMEKIIESDDELKNKKEIMKSYKGVGDQTANVLLAELPELGLLSKKEIASLVGLAPKLYHSGIKNPGGHILGGRFYVRKALYMAALVAMRYNEKIKVFYERLLKAGKMKKVAIIAVMRKMIVCLNAMLKNNEIYA